MKGARSRWGGAAPAGAVQVAAEGGGSSAHAAGGPGGELVSPAGAADYRNWVFSLVAPHIGERVVELGAGTGRMFSRVDDRTRAVAIEPSPSRSADLQRRYAGRANVEVYQADPGDPVLWGAIMARGALDSAMSFTVFERTEDDVAVMRLVLDALSPGGRMVIFTPAFPRLYGAMDAAAGHVRRYRRRELASKARTAGFRVIDCHYADAPGFLLWFLDGRVAAPSRIAAGRRAVMALGRAVAPRIRAIERRRHPPFGRSLLLIAERPAGPQ